MAQTYESRKAFLLGYDDCYVDTIGNKRIPGILERTMIVGITEFYQSPGDISVGVSRVIKSLGQRYKNRPPVESPGGEKWPEKHRFLDGMYWLGAEESIRLSFVSGFIECANNESKSHFRFAGAPIEYVKVLNLWYQDVKNGPEETREKAKIADVLLRFADKKDPFTKPKRESVASPKHK